MDRPRMQDIADEAGVGKATVSLALRDDPRIRLSTRNRIKAVADRLGYKCNPTVANLMAQLRASRSAKYQATLAFINACSDSPELRASSDSQAWLRGAQERAKKLGYEVDFFWLHEPGVTPARRLKIIQSRGIKGILVAAMTDVDSLGVEHADLWPGFSNVAIGRRLMAPPLNFACNDQYATILQALAEARKAGYQRPGLVLQERIDQVTDLRYSAGFWAGQQKISPENRLPIHYQTDLESFIAWYQKNRPDVILTLDQDMPHLIDHQTGSKETGWIHLDWQPEMLGWAGMNQNNEMVGATAVDLLIGQIHRNETGVAALPSSVLISSSWVPGDSLRPKNAAASKVARGSKKSSAVPTE